jgi:predicted DNA-binding ribbon-helix-helix protein
MYEKIEEIASRKDVTVEILIRQWVEEKLAEV